MSGTVRGVVDALSTQANEFRVGADIFKTFFDALEAHPNTTRVALQHGLGGTGTDYWDGANPFGRNAFAVWRFEPTGVRAWPWYLLMQTSCGDGTSAVFGAAPGDPATTNAGTASGTAFVAMAAAIGMGGDQNPWNGTTNNDGTDSKGGSAAFPAGNDGNGGVWRVPAGGTRLAVLPRINSDGGANAAIRQSLYAAQAQVSPAFARYSLIMDDDSLVSVIDVTDDNNNVVLAFSLYDVHPNLTADRPFWSCGWVNEIPTVTINENAAGVVVPAALAAAEPVITLNFDFYEDVFNAVTQPNQLFTPNQFDLVPMIIRGNEAGQPQGVVGTTDAFVRACFNVPPASSGNSLALAVFGANTTASRKAVIPWDGATTPKTTNVREGVAF